MKPIAEAFRDSFATGKRILIAPCGGYAILGDQELASLARDPLANGMAPDPAAMAGKRDPRSSVD